jgi:hypothetical protein
VTARVIEVPDPPWCHLCPLWDGEWSTCGAMLEPREGRMMYRETECTDDGAPGWCPLRSGGVIVRLTKTKGASE